MTRNKPAGTTLAVICAVIVVSAILAPSVNAAVPPPSADAIAAMQQQATADCASSRPPDDDACLSEPSQGPRIIQIRKSWVESWAVGDDQDPPDGPPQAENRRPGVRDDGPQNGGRANNGDWPDRTERPKVLLFSDDRRIEKVGPSPRGLDRPVPPSPAVRQDDDRRPDKQDRGPWTEISQLLKSFNDLIDFYEEQGRWEDKERALKQRIDICRKLAELRLLAETDGPGAAMQEFYRSIHRPDRALELDLHNIERELDKLAQKSAELEAEMARLAGRRDLLERKMGELNDRREQRSIELDDLHEQMENQQAGDDEDDDDEDAAIGPNHTPYGDLSAQLETIENALADQSLAGTRRARLERRHARVLTAPVLEATEPAISDRESEPAGSGTEVHQDSDFTLETTVLLNILDPPQARHHEYTTKARQWVRRKLAEIGTHIQRIKVRSDWAVTSTVMGPPQDCD
jgi:hypothetical protein